MPNRFIPLGANSSLEDAVRVVNANFAQIDNETVTKTFKQANGNAIVEGKLPYDGGYGNLYYDTSGMPRIVIGIAPDGQIDIGVTKQGFDITQQYT